VCCACCIGEPIKVGFHVDESVVDSWLQLGHSETIPPKSCYENASFYCGVDTGASGTPRVARGPCTCYLDVF